MAASNERLNSIIVKVSAGLGSPPSPFQSTIIERTGVTREEAWAMDFYNIAMWNTFSQAIQNIEQISRAERDFVDRVLRVSYGRGGPAQLWYESTRPVINA